MNPKANTKKEKGFVLNPEINYKKAGKKKQINRKAKQNFPKETSKKLKLKPNIEKKNKKHTQIFTWMLYQAKSVFQSQPFKKMHWFPDWTTSSTSLLPHKNKNNSNKEKNPFYRKPVQSATMHASSSPKHSTISLIDFINYQKIRIDP